ncbi:hypothetical protein BT67DRAFT_444280 [Trichocladium antarcticum]|uniref:Pentatricopeptide repeat protein n=1 Tax=Trichocladium antarcticum TaxID=1450529 RepID=A0AAN6UFC0_9PEZI|nr:hypothetical protein BT67DRAFT_444280 [Trichocladium antarcticum]
MPPRPFAFDLGRCSSYVCKSCLDSLRPVNARPWLARPSSSVARKPQSPLPPTNSDKGQAFPEPAELERMLAEELERPEPSDQSLQVNFFTQAAPGKLRRLRDNEEFGEMNGGLDAEIETAINKMEKQMVDTMRMLDRMEKGGAQDKADQLRKQFKKTLRVQYKGKTGPEAESYGLLRIAGFSGPRQRPVANLNIFLARDSVVRGGIPKPKDVTECWKYYSAARKTLSTAWEKVPQEAWNFLWMVLAWQGEGVENPNRMRHVYILSKDMQAAGVPLRDSQQLLATEAMFIEGWQDEAIEAWKKAVATLGARPETFEAYWELGVRMCALRGDTARAQRAADTLLRSSRPPNIRILLPIIRALAAKEGAIDDAWESYCNMRVLLGESMTIEDYDEVIAVFLTANSVEYALQAFVDMMFSGAIDIRGKTRLPLTVGNHFFMGKWLKRLIGVGDLDGAYRVVVYSQRRGITASPIQLNGLIGAWLRSGSAENAERADALAWSMIRARLGYVEQRQRQELVRFCDPYAATETGEGEGEPEFVCQTRATAETFSLMAENYCARRLHDRLQELFKVLKQAEIGPTTYLMNQLIRSYSHNGETEQALRLYQTMTKEQNMAPDGHTFLTLFNSLSVNRLMQRDPDLAQKDITACRGFFKDMVEADWTFDTPEIFAQLPRTVLFTMLKAKDFRGMIVAARAMRELFAFHPPESLLLELATGSGSMQIKTKRNMERLVAGQKTIETLVRQHRMGLVRQGHRGMEMTEEEKVDELDEVLERLVLLKAGAQDAPRSEVQPLLEGAAHEMGVYDIVFRQDAGQIAKHSKLGKQMAAFADV